MSATVPAARPIGYWLKHLDNLLEQHFDATLSGLGVNRRSWQVLNTLALHGPLGSAGLTDALAPFWTEGGPTSDEVLAWLTARHWIHADADGRRALTDAGRAAHTQVRAGVESTRANLVTGLTGEQYTETVRVLSVMAGNVEAALAAR
ncbi:MarR family transcriptional regulator [Streptomyces sp. NPDC005811]|uniref:MarR family winged helix-turn-helix transcriptional regulator n=1 Tax=Streptomyces sp. NPDC005811 TaxID=3154565 RepID=UPI0033D5797A